LNDLYGANDLEKYEGLIDFEFKKINNKVSLTTAAIAASNGRRTKALNEIEVSCACKGKCDDKRCKCFKNDIKCNSHFTNNKSRKKKLIIRLLNLPIGNLKCRICKFYE